MTDNLRYPAFLFLTLMAFSLMNVTFNGYLVLTCNGCNKPLTVESQALRFEQDSSPEAEDDDYIRYITQIDTRCAICSTKLCVKIDVWEYPEAVANYSYYCVEGAHDIQCEFNIEHYFDDEATHDSGESRDAISDHKVKNEEGSVVEFEGEMDSEDDGNKFNEASDYDIYVDEYDDDN